MQLCSLCTSSFQHDFPQCSSFLVLKNYFFCLARLSLFLAYFSNGISEQLWHAVSCTSIKVVTLTVIYSLNRSVLSICDKPVNHDQFNWSFPEPSSTVFLSEGVCWCDCVMIMKLGPQKPVSLTEWSPWGFCDQPHSSINNDRFLPAPSFLSFCLSNLSVSFSIPGPCICILLFQLFINAWWMLLCEKVSLKSFSFGGMKMSCNRRSISTIPIMHPFSA